MVWPNIQQLDATFELHYVKPNVEVPRRRKPTTQHAARHGTQISNQSRLLRIGELARRSGVSIDTIRFYEGGRNWMHAFMRAESWLSVLFASGSDAAQVHPQRQVAGTSRCGKLVISCSCPVKNEDPTRAFCAS